VRVTGIQPWSGCTMQVMVLINDAHLSTLLDSRSTHNFVDSVADSRAELPLTKQTVSLSPMVTGFTTLAATGTYGS
jgi:hypothetical protein